MKTIKEWVCELPQPYRQQALKYESKKWSDKVASMAQAIISMVRWGQTKEGGEYWQKLHSKYPVVDMRKVKKHSLYQVINEYVTEYFDGHPDLSQLTIANVETLSADLHARFGKLYSYTQVEKILKSYGEPLITGGYYFKRSDFYVPVTN